MAGFAAACGGDELSTGGDFADAARTGGDCSSDTCDGCCTPEGTCITNVWDRQCGSAGTACLDCTEDGRSCNEEVGRCEKPPECDATNCPNGCCVGDECVEPGDEADACGSRGIQCEICGEGEICDGDQCRQPCGPDNCAGCCADDGTCIEDPEDPDAACGVAGAACQACEEGAFCNAEGQCVEESCENTCDGCCTEAGDCIEGADLENRQCGFNGAACVDCTVDNEVCADPGVCVDAECAATCTGGCCGPDGCNPDGNIDPDACGVDGNACIDCGPNSICENGTCRIDPDSLWDVVVEATDVPELDQNNESWDGGGGSPPDPLVELVVGLGTDDERSASTPAGSDTSFVDYDSYVILEDVPARALLGEAQVLWIWWDDDGWFNFDDQMSLELPGAIPEERFSDELTRYFQPDFYDDAPNSPLEFNVWFRLLPAGDTQLTYDPSTHTVNDAPLCRPDATGVITASSARE